MGLNNTEYMGVATTRHNRFFMTRQIATILEDLDRQLLMVDRISLLYGKNGVGKTRLLQQFIATRHPNIQQLFVRFSADGTCTYNDKRYFQSDISKILLPEIKQLSLLILDQFEHALTEVSRDLLKMWAQTMRNQSKLVLCGRHELMASLPVINKSLQYPIDSVELKPLSQSDRQDYLAALLCPAPDSYPAFRPPVKKLIRNSEGLFGNLDDLYKQYAQSIECKPGNAMATAMDSKKILMLVSLAVVFGAFLVFAEVGLVPDSEPVNKQSPISQSAAATDDPAVVTDDEVQEVQQKETAAREQIVEAGVANAAEKGRSRHSVAGEEPEAFELDTLPDRVSKPLEPAVTQVRPDESPLQRRIVATQVWLEEADHRTASIQLMTLKRENDGFDAMSRYLTRLSTAGIDLQDIFIYSAPSSKVRIYGVLYGSYASRSEAQEQMETLPDILRANKPILRTVKGIKQEILKNSQS
jgi:hypothetical protein